MYWIVLLQEIFRKIYENHNEEVYLKDVVVFLRAAYQDIDDIHDVSASHLSNLDITFKVEIEVYIYYAKMFNIWRDVSSW